MKGNTRVVGLQIMSSVSESGKRLMRVEVRTAAVEWIVQSDSDRNRRREELKTVPGVCEIASGERTRV